MIFRDDARVEMGSLPGGCEGAAGLLAWVWAARPPRGALLPGMWSLWPGGGLAAAGRRLALVIRWRRVARR